MSLHAGEPATRGLRFMALGITVLAIAWGIALGVRPVLAYGLTQAAVLVLLWAYPRVALRRVALEREMTGSACEDDEVPVTFTIQNRSRLPLFVPEIEDRFTPDKIVRRLAFVFPVLPGRSQARTHYRGSCFSRRGLYVIGPARVRLTCPTGLFAAERVEAGPTPLTVYPGLEPLPEVANRSSGLAPSFGGRARREAGEGDMTLMVREYRPGDPLRRIHWPTTARRGRLSILEYERQRGRRVTVALDLSRASLRGLGRQATVEVAVRVAASASASFLDRGDRVALRAEGGSVVEVPAGRGRAQLCRILAELATVRADGTLPLPELIASLIASLIPGQGLFCIVSNPEEDGPLLLEQLVTLQTLGIQQTFVLLDPATFPRIFAAPERTQPAMTLVELCEAFLSRGAVVYVVRAGEPLAEAFYAPWFGRQRLRITRAML